VSRSTFPLLLDLVRDRAGLVVMLAAAGLLSPAPAESENRAAASQRPQDGLRLGEEASSYPPTPGHPAAPSPVQSAEPRIDPGGGPHGMAPPSRRASPPTDGAAAASNRSRTALVLYRRHFSV